MSQRKKSTSGRRKSEKRVLTVICILLGVVTVALVGYAAGWYANRARIEQEQAQYQSLYTRSESTPHETLTPVSAAPTSAAAPVQTLIPDPTAAAPIVTPVPDPTVEVLVTVEPTPSPLAYPEVVDVPLATANADTLILSLPTPPPIQDSFSELLTINPDTVGYLEIPDLLSLPVVQRENDNTFYLNHSFDGGEALEGTLFLDGVNRLSPEDDSLIVYGHNMKNGTMFGSLSRFEEREFIRSHPIVRFDTLYENRVYVPFAAFTASMDPDDPHYFEVRRFIFDEEGFELFTLKLQARSMFRLPVDVVPGDRLLLLVTCDYTNREGRFILALRQLRSDEREADILMRFEQME